MERNNRSLSWKEIYQQAVKAVNAFNAEFSGSEAERKQAVDKLSKGLTPTQKAKLRQRAKGIPAGIKKNIDILNTTNSNLKYRKGSLWIGGSSHRGKFTPHPFTPVELERLCTACLSTPETKKFCFLSGKMVGDAKPFVYGPSCVNAETMSCEDSSLMKDVWNQYKMTNYDEPKQTVRSLFSPRKKTRRSEPAEDCAFFSKAKKREDMAALQSEMDEFRIETDKDLSWEIKRIISG